MAADRRTEAAIRSEIATEREQLAGALADLRASIDEKRRLAAVAAVVLVTGLATVTALRLVRRIKRE